MSASSSKKRERPAKSISIKPEHRTTYAVAPDVEYRPNFISEEVVVRIMESFKELPFKPTTHVMMNMIVNSSVEYVWVTDTGLPYTFGRTLTEPLQPHSFDEFPVLKELQKYVEAVTKRSFNSVLVNRYFTGENGLSPHSDDDPWLGKDFIVPSVSFGQARTFRVAQKPGVAVDLGQSSPITVDYLLESGSLLIMGESVQKYWVHSIPKSKKPMSIRYNLTFRHVHPDLYHSQPKILIPLSSIDMSKYTDKRRIKE